MDLGTQTLPHLLDPRLWRYRGEGNANVVLGYVGDDPRYAHHVLRLRKKDPVASPATSNTDRTAEQGILDVAFGLHIVAPLIGAEYVGPVILLEVTPAFLEAVSDSIHPHRPPHRLAKLVHPAQRYAVLAQDHTRLPGHDQGGGTLSVEIKPKWGFLPISPHVHPAKRQACRFCMHQRLKRETGHMDILSAYCPLDLFSGEEGRVRQALEKLMRCPQNNLRVSWNGLGVEVGGKTYATTLSEFFSDPSQSANESTLIVLLSRILLREALLQRLKHLQRTLDALDVEGAYALYVRLVKEGIEIKEPDMGEWREVVRQYEERMRLEGSHRSLPLPDPADSTFDPAMALHHLREFLLSVTLKDCSIMIALGRSDSVLDPGVVVIPEELDVARPGRAFVYTMRTIDLDPKPTRNISHYRKLDERIVECFVRGEEGKRCVE